jgi:uncharacterized protein (TIGR03435 family)
VAPGSPAAAPASAAIVVMPPLNYGGPLPSFEVASVKKIPSSNTSLRLGMQGGRATITLPLRTLLLQVWNAKDFQIVGGPSWITTDRFAINAKAETDVPRDQVMLMLRALIIERFKFKFHIESRQMNTYVLMRPGPDSPLGPGLKAVDCSGPRPPTTTAQLEAALRGGSTAALPCGLLMSGSGGIRAGGTTMASLASLLASAVGSTVIDKTNMTGTYSFTLDFAVLSRLSLSAAAPGETLTPMSDMTTSGGSVFNAVKDLGLRLERKREAVDVLVIDSVEQPDED